jgi:hypothetical protein
MRSRGPAIAGNDLPDYLEAGVITIIRRDIDPRAKK